MAEPMVHCPTPLYRMRGVTHRYAQRQILDIAELDIFRGDVLGVTGMNGSGKSTLLKVLGMLEPIASGEFLFNGESVVGAESEIRRKACLLLQDSFLLKRSVFENIAYGLRLRKDVENLQARVLDALERVGLEPGNFVGRAWYQLSGGEVQRVALAARLALRPSVLLLDEPTANVDEASSFLLRRAALSAWNDWGATVIVATHDLTWLHEVATSTIALHEGRIIGRGVQNILSSDWLRERGGALCPLSSGASMRALLSPDDIVIRREGAPRGGAEITLSAQVTQMTLERGGKTLLVTAEVCDFSLKVRISTDEARELSLFPGGEVLLSFVKSAIRWQ